MKNPLPALILAALLPLGLPAVAEAASHAGHGSAAKSEKMSEGTVKKVDKAQGKVTIKHGPLENLKMPPMTMIFRVKEPEMLNSVKVGDSIRFQAEQVNGRFVVTRIEAAQ